MHRLLHLLLSMRRHTMTVERSMPWLLLKALTSSSVVAKMAPFAAYSALTGDLVQELVSHAKNIAVMFLHLSHSGKVLVSVLCVAEAGTTPVVAVSSNNASHLCILLAGSRPGLLPPILRVWNMHESHDVSRHPQAKYQGREDTSDLQKGARQRHL